MFASWEGFGMERDGVCILEGRWRRALHSRNLNAGGPHSHTE